MAGRQRPTVDGCGIPQGASGVATSTAHQGFDCPRRRSLFRTRGCGMTNRQRRQSAIRPTDGRDGHRLRRIAPGPQLRTLSLGECDLPHVQRFNAFGERDALRAQGPIRSSGFGRYRDDGVRDLQCGGQCFGYGLLVDGLPACVSPPLTLVSGHLILEAPAGAPG